MSERISILVKQDHLAQMANARTPLEAIAELVWNAFDSDATKVVVSFTTNALEALDEIRITDNGHGVFHSDAKQLFGNLGESWKRAKRRTDGGRTIHGKQGRGRFKAFYLGSGASWNTTYRMTDGTLYDYSIAGDYATLNAFTVSAPMPAKGNSTGTEVVIRNPHRNFRALLEDDVRTLAAQLFGAYLTAYPFVSVVFNGRLIDPQVVQARSTEVNLDLLLPDGATVPAALRVIEWKHETDRMLHLCDGSGVSFHSVGLGSGLRAKGFNFTAYLKTDLVRELDKENRLELDDLDEVVKTLVHSARETLRAYFKKRELEESSALVVRWQAENIYPYEEKAQLELLDSVERQVFDILAANVAGYLKSFEGLDQATKRFTFRLIAHSLRANPDGIRNLITESLNLNKEDQENLSRLLGTTSLSQIIYSAQVIRSRLGFLSELEQFTSATGTKEQLLERNQLHKILEKETWLFDESFQLGAGEEVLDAVLKKHLGLLGDRADSAATAGSEDGLRGCRDLMLNRTVQIRAGEYENLVVDLKRPSLRIDPAVLAQARQYATTVSADKRFQSAKTRWLFWVVGNVRSEEATLELEQNGPSEGIVLEQGNVTVLTKTWAELIDSARVSLGYCQRQLAIQAEREAAKSCLSRYHEKYLPAPQS
jgi:hypothetical protein